MVAAGCRSDGRVLRDPKPDQTQSISTTAASTLPVVVEPGDSSGSQAPTSAASTAPTAPPATFTVTAPWADNAVIDPRYTCDGPNVAPALSWSPAPAGTAEIAITLVDNDAPEFVHWVMAGIDPTAVSLAEATVPLGAYQAMNGAGQIGYFGPCAPAGSQHHYVVTVHYLGAALGFFDGDPGSDMYNSIRDSELASANVTGEFSRT
ncbi:MAG: hypothetical protein RLZ14_2237 [Actinomycetota bacterium]